MGGRVVEKFTFPTFSEWTLNPTIIQNTRLDIKHRTRLSLPNVLGTVSLSLWRKGDKNMFCPCAPNVWYVDYMQIVTARSAGGIAVNLPCSYFITAAKGPHEIYVGLCCFINMPLKDLKESLKLLKSVWINVAFWCIFVSVVLWPHVFLQHALFEVVSTSISSLCMSGMMGSSCSPFVQVDFNGTSQRSQTQRCLVKTWPVNWKFSSNWNSR